MDEKRIGDLLVEAGVISRDDLERVLKSKPLLGGQRVLSELYAMGIANERQLAEVLARRNGTPVAVLTESVVDLEVVKLVPVDMMKKHTALPIAADERSVTVVTPDVDAPGLFVPLGFATGRRVVPLLGIQSVLEHFIEESLKALVLGEKVLVGPKAPSRTPQVAVAKWAPALGVEEANKLAKEIAEALTWEETTDRTRIGVIRLKQMVIEQKAKDVPFVAEERTRPAAIDNREARIGGAPVADAHVDSGPITVPMPSEAELPLAVGEIEKQPIALVVDDDAGIRTLLVKALTHDGLQVVEAQNGEEATTMLRVMRPNVVLLDAMLPLVHGFEICASLKRSKLKSIPVIMISAVYRGWEQARDIQEVHGADFFVEKPFELTYLRRLVADVLKRPTAPVPRVDGTAARIEELKAKYDELVQRGLYFSADAFVEQWIDLDPFDGRAWLERGNICAQANDLVGAMAAYEASVVYESSLLVGHLALATVYERLGFVRRARTTWLRARELTPDVAMHERIDLHLAKTK